MSYALVNPFSTLRLVSDVITGRSGSRLGDTFREWRDRRAAYRATVDELSRLDDRELDDLGISRCDIYRIAEEAAATDHRIHRA